MAMAPPPWVLLDRQVRFLPVRTGGGARRKQAAEIVDKAKAMEALLQGMKPDPSVSEPPCITRLAMLQPMVGGLPGGFISSADKALAVLYAGHYRPCFSRSPSSGCYLVYDASSNSLTAVPQILPSHSFRSLGGAVAILSRGTGAYVLAEICVPASDRRAPDAVIYLWQQDRAPPPRWELKPVRLPSEVFNDGNYSIDMAFSYPGSSSTPTCICWVDLLKGILVCDPFMEPDDELTFVPLPQGYSIDFGNTPRPGPEEFRTMGCVNGVIKFVAVVGEIENNNLGSDDDLVLRSWTLSPDLKEWKECHPPLALQDLWASESFREMNLSNMAPTFPVVSVDENEVVYLSLKEAEVKNVYDIYGQYKGVEVVDIAHYVLRFDMIKNEVLDCRNTIQSTFNSHWPIMLASEFTAYLSTVWKHHEGETEASKAGTSKKQVGH